MAVTIDRKKLDFETPATYCIEVSGQLTESLRRRVAEGSIEISEGDNDSRNSVLVLHVEDQAELIGLLDALYASRLTVINIRRRRNDQIDEILE